MVIDVLQYLGVNKAKSCLDDSEHHIIVFVFVFEQEDDINDVVQNVAHFLTVNILRE